LAPPLEARHTIGDVMEEGVKITPYRPIVS
jgi:hypothetical protein